MAAHKRIMTDDRHGFFPTADEELLLKACLLRGDDAVLCWRGWRDRVDIEGIDLGTQRLLPLLYANLHDLGVADPALARYKNVYRHARLHNQVLTRQALEALELLAGAGIEGMLLKGIAFIALYYGQFGLRPMNDIDVMVRPETAEQAVDVLLGAGWRVKHPDWTVKWMIAHGHAVTLERGASELDLHWRVLQDRYYISDEQCWTEGQTVAISGKPAKTLSDTDHLLHTCVHGARWNEVSPIRWVADAAFILRRGSIDWSRLMSAARTLRTDAADPRNARLP